MKKQKFMKLSAFVSDPSLENSFSAPVSHSGEISVVFKGKNISIHGWDGSAWTTIYTWNNLDPQFKFENTYQNYYLKSLTGSEETMSVSFFSTDNIANSIPPLAGVNREVKFYDVEEVPVYRPSDVNKMLTIMSDGSLAWLLASESFIVPSEGEEGEAPNEPVVVDVIENVWNNPNTTKYGNPTYENGILTLDGTSFMTHGDISEYMYTDYQTVNLWYKNDGGNRYGHMFGFGWINSSDNNKDGSALTQWNSGRTDFDPVVGNGVSSNHTSTSDGQWHMVTVTWDNVSGMSKIYMDGVFKAERAFAPKSDPYRNGDDVYGLIIGTISKNGGLQGNQAYLGQFTNMTIENSVWDAAAVSDIYAAGRGGSEPAQTYLEETATLYGDANISGGALVLDGNGDYAVIDDGFRFTDTLSTSIWFKTTATGDRRIYSSHVRGMTGDDFRNGFFARLNNGQLKYRHPSGGTAELTGPSGLNDGQWHHMAVTWENNVGYTLYVDGSQVATGAAGASDGYVSGWGLYIGANPWLNNNPYGFFSGEVSKFEVLNEVLTAQDVADRYNAGV
jgi:hypothetical protein